MRSASAWILTTAMINPVTEIFADEWLGIEQTPVWTVGFIQTWEQSEDQSTLLYLNRTTETFSTDLQYNRSTLVEGENDFDSESYLGNINVPINPQVEIGVGYQFQGQQNELEIEMITATISYLPYPFYASMEYSDGDLYLFTRDDLPDTITVPDSVRSSINSQSLQLGWWFDDINFSARYQQYDYERDISALSTRLVIQFLVKPAALAQSGLLVSKQSTLSVNIPVDHHELAIHIQSTTSAVDGSDTQSIQLDWVKSLESNSNLYLSLARSDQNEDYWSIGAGLEWMH